MSDFDGMLIGSIIVGSILLVIEHSKNRNIFRLIIVAMIIMIIASSALAHRFSWESDILGIPSRQKELVSNDVKPTPSTDVGLNVSNDVKPTPSTDWLRVSDDAKPTPKTNNDLSVVAYEGSDSTYKNQLKRGLREREISPFNSSDFTLHVMELALEINIGEDDQRTLGNNYIDSALATLYDYKTDKVVQKILTDENGEAYFTDLSDGMYYYTVASIGHKPVISDYPFRIKLDPNEPTDKLPWSVDLEKYGVIYSTPFQIKLTKRSGKPLRNIEVQVGTYRLDSDTQIRAEIPMHTDSNGYLTLWHGINGKDFYDLATFRIIDGLDLEIIVDDKEYYITPSYDQEYIVVID